MDRPHQKSSGVPLRKPPCLGKLFWLTAPRHFLRESSFNCDCQGASSGGRYHHSLSPPIWSPLEDSQWYRLPRHWGPQGKWTKAARSLWAHIPSALSEIGKKKENNTKLRSQKWEHGYPSSFNVLFFLCQKYYIHWWRENERIRWRWRGGGERRKWPKELGKRAFSEKQIISRGGGEIWTVFQTRERIRLEKYPVVVRSLSKRRNPNSAHKIPHRNVHTPPDLKGILKSHQISNEVRP